MRRWRLETTQQTVGRWERGQEPQPRWRPRLEAFIAEDASPQPLLRLAPAIDAGPSGPSSEPPLTARQQTAIDGFLRRLGTGVPLAPHEAKTFGAAFLAVGLDPP